MHFHKFYIHGRYRWTYRWMIFSIIFPKTTIEYAVKILAKLIKMKDNKSDNGNYQIPRKWKVFDLQYDKDHRNGVTTIILLNWLAGSPTPFIRWTWSFQKSNHGIKNSLKCIKNYGFSRLTQFSVKIF